MMVSYPAALTPLAQRSFKVGGRWYVLNPGEKRFFSGLSQLDFNVSCDCNSIGNQFLDYPNVIPEIDLPNRVRDWRDTGHCASESVVFP